MNIWMWEYWMWETWQQIGTLIILIFGFFICLHILSNLYWKISGKKKPLKGKVVDDDEEEKDDDDDW